MKSIKMFLSTGIVLAIALFSSVQLSGMQKNIEISQIDMVQAKVDALINRLVERGMISLTEIDNQIQKKLQLRGLTKPGEYGIYLTK